jgi:hypothetical protein
MRAPAAACTLGIAPHSGWAVVVIVAGTAATPRVLARERLELAEDRLSGSRQPYHAIEELPLPEARRRVAGFEASAAGLARAALERLLERAAADGATARGAGILDSAGRSGVTLEAILASHALIHTADGQHFRAALAGGCEALGLAVTRVPQRELTSRATAVLRRPAAELAATVAALGRTLGPPWGADQKSAALLGWMLLAQGS